MSLTIVFRPGGQGLAIYDEALNLQAVGAITIQRASHVEPNTDGSWSADLSPVGGPVLGPFPHRSQALQAEIDWLASWLRSQPLARPNSIPINKLNKEMFT